MAAALTLWVLGLATPADVRAQNRTHTVYYEGTDHELHVYRIWGKKPGKTLLLIGGIQGDEPGGFLSADHYADLALAKGNLIVVPRANFQSIVLKRRIINEDMNRKFAESRQDNYEAKIVRILKTLIQESNCLLNLHDGSGFYSDTWESSSRNPRRYGQSIIADSETYANPQTGERLDLGELARVVCREINQDIENPKYHFHFNNHRTHDADSMNKEQRKSATYYALYKMGIPAFGIETSKSLPLELKVRHHNLAINAFMKRLDIVTETPGLNLEPPVMRYMVLSVNDALPMAIKNGQTLTIRPGDSVKVSHIEANYERGLSADIIGSGTMNDFRKKTRVYDSTRIVARKDYIDFGTIHLDVDIRRGTPASAASSRLPEMGAPFLLFRVKINAQERLYQSGTTVQMIKGDLFELVDAMAGGTDSRDLLVNFKGFVGNRATNTGEDRGYEIDTGRDLWQRYSIHKKGEIYPVVVSKDERVLGKLFVQLAAPRLQYVILGQENGPALCITPDDSTAVVAGRPIRMLDINTNVSGNLGVRAFVSSPGRPRQPISVNEPFFLNERGDADPVHGKQYHITIMRGTMVIGKIPLILGQSFGKAVSEEGMVDRENISLEKKRGKTG
ncbi:Putative periplasmic protein [Olavius algarvensis associated proteobacterium Delta 3]|nr:Putative periplasmic protein [Olavius algarvensis associated proteobacterium Delta 3]